MALNREFLQGLNLEDSVINSIMGEHGKSVSNLKELEAQNKSLTEQLAGRDSQLEELKKSTKDSEELQATIKQLQDDNEKTKSDYEAQLTATQRDNAIEIALRDAGARNSKAVKALLDNETLTFKDGKLGGFNEQLEAIKKDNDYLFQSDEPQEDPKPKFTGGGNSEPKPAAANSMAEALGITTTNK